MTYPVTHNLKTYRRHSQRCILEGTDKRGLCDCTIWVRGRASRDSEPVRYSLETSDVAMANRKVQDLIRGINPRVKITFTVSDAVTRWLALYVEYPDQGLAAGTIVSYKSMIRQLVKAIGGMPVNAVSQDTINNYRAFHREHVSPGRWLLELVVLRMFFTWCAASPREWITGDPTEGVTRPPKPELCTPPLSDDEVVSIIEACDRIGESSEGLNPNQIYARQRARALVSVLLHSGLRISDVATLRRKSLNPATGHLTLRTVKTGTTVKVQLPPETVKLLLALPAENPEYFFWAGESQLDNMCRVLRRVIRRLGEIAGMDDLHPHRFRDTFAVALLSEGTDIRQVQKLLGHSSVAVTEKHYAHFTDRQQDLLDAATARLHFGVPRTPVLLKPVARRRG
jgi:integrase